MKEREHRFQLYTDVILRTTKRSDVGSGFQNKTGMCDNRNPEEGETGVEAAIVVTDANACPCSWPARLLGPRPACVCP